jgi:hypothetical protein
MNPESSDGHLDIELYLPQALDDIQLPHLYIGLDINLLSPGDAIVTDRHHASF